MTCVYTVLKTSPYSRVSMTAVGPVADAEGAPRVPFRVTIRT